MSEATGQEVIRAALTAVLPATGEVVGLAGLRILVNAETPYEGAQALDQLRDLEDQIRDVKRAISRGLAEEARRRGTGTMELGDLRVKVTQGSTREVDAQKLEDGLRDAGMPEDQVQEVVVLKVTKRVALARADRAAKANPAYAKVLADATTVVDATPSVKVER